MNTFKLVCSTLVVVFMFVATSSFASTNVHLYLAPLESKGADEIVSNMRKIWDQNVSDALKGSNIDIAKNIPADSIVFQGGQDRSSTLFFSLKGETDVDLALVGVIEGSHDPESSRKYRMSIRLLGQSKEGIVYSYISPFVEKSKIEEIVKDSALRIAEKLNAWEKTHPRKSKEAISDNKKENQRRLTPNASIVSVLPFGKFKSLAANGFGLCVGAGYDYRELTVLRPARVVLRPSLSFVRFSPNRSTVNSLWFYTATAGAGLQYDFSPLMVTPFCGAGYLLGVMNSSNRGRSKYYHEPIFYLSADFEYRFSRVSISAAPMYQLFIDKNNIGQSIGISFGALYAL
ncbi:MAG TPA: hypothetical protein VF857_09700 [Spirochaetota bacterium]